MPGLEEDIEPLTPEGYLPREVSYLRERFADADEGAKSDTAEKNPEQKPSAPGQNLSP